LRPASRVPTERVEERVGIETIERDGDGARLESRDQALLLVSFNTGTGRVIKPTEELVPGFFKALVSGGGINKGSINGATLIRDPNQAVEGLMY